MKHERAHLVVYGAVQGVGFRWFVQSTARSLDLAGLVRNRPDGTVELEAEGAADAIATLNHTVQHGPPGANVSRIEQLPPGAEPLPRPFRILR